MSSLDINQSPIAWVTFTSLRLVGVWFLVQGRYKESKGPYLEIITTFSFLWGIATAYVFLWRTDFFLMKCYPNLSPSFNQPYNDGCLMFGCVCACMFWIARLTEYPLNQTYTCMTCVPLAFPDSGVIIHVCVLFLSLTPVAQKCVSWTIHQRFSLLLDI